MRPTARKIAALFIALLASPTAYSQSLTIQGKVTNASGQPVVGPNTQFQVQILSPDTAGCVLYDETFSVDLSASYGLFSLNLNAGLGTRNAPSTYTLEQAISNRSSLTTNSGYCKTGTGSVVYSPSPTDNRRVLIKFRDPASMTGWETIPEMDLNPVAYAMETRALGGFPASSVLRVQDPAGPAPAAAFSSGQFADLQALVGGTSNKYMVSGGGSAEGARLPTASGRPASPAAGSIWFDTVTGSVKYYDGSGDRTIGSSGAGGASMVTSIAGGAGISASSATGAITISLTASGVGAAGTVGSASAIPEIEFDTYGRIVRVDSHPINGLLPAAGVDHQALKSSGGAWGADFIGKADLRVSAGQELFPGTCNVNQTINFDSVAGRFVCQDVGGITSAQLAAASGTAVGTYRSVSINAAGQVVAGTNPTTLGDYFIGDAVQNGGSVPRIRSGAADPSGAGVDGELYVATGSQKIFRYDLGTTTWQTMASAGGAGGTVTGITAGSGIAVSGSTTTPTVSLSTAGVTAGTFAKVTTDAYGRVTSGSAQVGDGDISDLAFTKLTGKPATLLGHGITENLVTNAGGAASLQAGPTGSRPSPGTAGQIYIDTDTNAVYYRGASTWQTVASAAGSGGTLTDVYSGAGVNVTGSGTTRTVALTDVGTASTGLVKVNTDAKGRVTGGATTIGNADITGLAFSKLTGTPTTVGDYGITDAVKNTDGTVPNILSGNDTAKPSPAAGNLNFIYIANDTQKIYRQISGTWQVIGAGTTAGFTGSLAGEVSGGQATTQVDQIGSFLRATILSLFTNVQNATDTKTNGAIVKRDGSGGFAAGAITADTVVLKGTTSGTATLRAPATVTNYDVQLPAAAPAAGQVLSATSGTALTWTTPLTGSTIGVNAPVTNTAGTIGINAASGSQAGALSSADWTTFNNKLSTALTAASIWVGNASNVAAPVVPSGDVAMTNAGAFTVNGIKGQNISAAGATAGQMLRYAGSNTWTPNFVSMADLRSTVTGTQAITGNCTASQTLTWNSGSDNLQCQSISIAAATQITGVLPVANGGTGAATVTGPLVFAGPASGTAAPSFRALAASDLAGLANQWSESNGHVFRGTGNVGIGTSNPTQKLQVSGSVVIDNNNAYYLRDAAGGNTGFVSMTSADNLQIGTNGSTGGSVQYFSNGGEHKFYTAGSEKLTIRNSGFVGVGTNNPLRNLDIVGNFGVRPTGSGYPLLSGGLSSSWSVVHGGGNWGLTVARNTADAGYSNFGFFKTRSADVSVNVPVQDGDGIGRFTWQAVGADSAAYEVAGIYAQVSGTPTGSTIPVSFDIRTEGVNRISVAPGGRVGINTNAPQAGLDIATTGAASALIVPRDNTTNRPTGAAAVNGMIRYNTTSNALEAYIAGAWSNLATIGGSSTFTTVGVGAGSATNPSLSFSGDTNTGFYNTNSDDKISVAANGAKIFDFSSSGLVSPTTGGAAVSSANGTAAAPTYGFAGEAGLGWYRPAAGTLAAATGSAERMRISSTGNVGIGTSNPLGLLHVHNTVAQPPQEFTLSSGTSAIGLSSYWPTIEFNSFQQGGGATKKAYGAGYTGAIFFDPSSGNFTWATGTAPGAGNATTESARIFIKQTGEIGVNTTAPTSAFELVSASADGKLAFSFSDNEQVSSLGSLASIFGGSMTLNMDVGHGDYALINRWAPGTAANRGFSFYQQTGTGTFSPLMRILGSSGNVGIGTSAPAARLSVVESSLRQFSVGGPGSNWADVSSAGGGAAYFGSNGYLNAGDNTFRYAQNHSLSGGIGSRGLAINYPSWGDQTFVTSNGNTTKDASFTPTNLMTIKASGNVGIGTANPSYLFHVYQDVAGLFRTAITNVNTAGFQQTDLMIGRGTATADVFLGTNYLNAQNSYLDNRSGGPMRFMTNGGDQMTILTNGRVGIGTTAPNERLEIANGGINLPSGAINFNALTNTGTLGVGSSDYAYIRGEHDVNTEVSRLVFMIGDNTNDSMVFRTDYSSGANTPTDVMTIRNGVVGVGNNGIDTHKFSSYGSTGQHGVVGSTTDTSNNYYGVIGYGGSYSGALGRSDGYAFVGTGNVWATGNGMFNQSDVRYKENVKGLDSSLAKILKLRPVSYTWKKDSEAHKSTGDKAQFGLIAQEVQKVLPDIVIMNHKPPTSPNKDGSKTLDAKIGESLGVEYTKIIPFLIGAVQELKGQVDGIFAGQKADHAELERVKAENAELRAYLCAKDPSAPFCTKKRMPSSVR